MEVTKGQVYRPFKGDLMTIVAVAKHTETEELMVVYEHNGTIWARPYDMFLSKVDKKKYPDVEQEYRFQLVDSNDVSK